MHPLEVLLKMSEGVEAYMDEHIDQLIMPLDLNSGEEQNKLALRYQEYKVDSVMATLFAKRRYDLVILLSNKTKHKYCCTGKLLAELLCCYTEVLEEFKEAHLLIGDAFFEQYKISKAVLEKLEQIDGSIYAYYFDRLAVNHMFYKAMMTYLHKAADLSACFTQTTYSRVEGGTVRKGCITCVDVLMQYYNIKRICEGPALKMYDFVLFCHRLFDLIPPDILDMKVNVACNSLRTKLNVDGKRPKGFITGRFLMNTTLMCALVRDMALKSEYSGFEFKEIRRKAELVSLLLKLGVSPMKNGAYDLICLLTDGGYGMCSAEGSGGKQTFELRMAIRREMEKFF
jgi:hypothetical protein